MRLIIATLIAATCLFSAGCDSTGEAPARFDGRYRAVGPWEFTVRPGGGPYGYEFDIRVTNGADGVVSGSGTFVFISERSGPQPRAVTISGITEGRGVRMRMSTDGYEDLAFWGRVLHDGEVIDGSLSTSRASSVPVTFEEVP